MQMLRICWLDAWVAWVGASRNVSNIGQFLFAQWFSGACRKCCGSPQKWLERDSIWISYPWVSYFCHLLTARCCRDGWKRWKEVYIPISICCCESRGETVFGLARRYRGTGDRCQRRRSIKARCGKGRERQLEYDQRCHPGTAGAQCEYWSSREEPIHKSARPCLTARRMISSMRWHWRTSTRRCARGSLVPSTCTRLFYAPLWTSSSCGARGLQSSALFPKGTTWLPTPSWTHLPATGGCSVSLQPRYPSATCSMSASSAPTYSIRSTWTVWVCTETANENFSNTAKPRYRNRRPRSRRSRQITRSVGDTYLRAWSLGDFSRIISGTPSLTWRGTATRASRTFSRRFTIWNQRRTVRGTMPSLSLTTMRAALWLTGCTSAWRDCSSSRLTISSACSRSRTMASTAWWRPSWGTGSSKRRVSMFHYWNCYILLWVWRPWVGRWRQSWARSRGWRKVPRYWIVDS